MGTTLYVGHEWIEILDDAGNVGYSAGFWPTGSVFASPGKVISPDPKQGKTKRVKSLKISRTDPGKGTAFNCDKKDCDDIKKCVKGGVTKEKASPGTYSVAFRNCRDWVTVLLTKCCILK